MLDRLNFVVPLSITIPLLIALAIAGWEFGGSYY